MVSEPRMSRSRAKRCTSTLRRALSIGSFSATWRLSWPFARRQPHFAHAALADRALEPVRADLLAGSELRHCQRGGRSGERGAALEQIVGLHRSLPGQQVAQRRHELQVFAAESVQPRLSRDSAFRSIA